MASKKRKQFYKGKYVMQKHLEKRGQLWLDISNVTGGAIAFHKCGWKILVFDDSQFSPTIQVRLNGSIKLHNAMG